MVAEIRAAIAAKISDPNAEVGAGVDGSVQPGFSQEESIQSRHAYACQIGLRGGQGPNTDYRLRFLLGRRPGFVERGCRNRQRWLP